MWKCDFFLRANTRVFLQRQKSYPSVCRRHAANNSGLCCSAQTGACEAESLISPEAQRGIYLLPTINTRAAKHANQFYWFLLAFVLPHASPPPMWYSLWWPCNQSACPPLWAKLKNLLNHEWINMKCCVDILGPNRVHCTDWFPWLFPLLSVFLRKMHQ